MVDQLILKILLSPLALLYGVVVGIRNGLYNVRLLRGVTFSIPVISIGNLSVGGTGKTPHTEYLVRLLHEYLKIGILSRGYRRKSSGYLEVQSFHDATQAGDEPLQYKRKFPDVHVAVSESRSLGIPQLIRTYPDIQVVLMDDGFQHREVTPGLNILLTDYSKLYTEDWLLPIGTLREWRRGADRADLVVVTKCPAEISEDEMQSISQKVARDEDQGVFFSHYRYGHPYKMYNSAERIVLNPQMSVLVIAALAGTDYLMQYLSTQVGEARILKYTDHHSFSNFDIGNIERFYKELPDSSNSIILTTEKDAMRLDSHRELLLRLNLPIYILPIAVSFLGKEPDAFDRVIKDWLLNFKR